jgi:hypothetical protein
VRFRAGLDLKFQWRKERDPDFCRFSGLDSTEGERRQASHRSFLAGKLAHFEVPGTKVDMTGQYALDGNTFDFYGKVRLEAKLSHMVTGWKSVLLKPVDPFFKKDGAGTEVPIKITGTKSEPHIGLDFGHKDENK